MQYGFVIDNRKCIGCHACTTACKQEHEVPLGVFRTWVKQVEKGEFPNTRRVFSVLRCNHCSDAPCVEICPTEALFIRPDGIVDFDKNRCIGCKSCMQACPYDALYIDPDTNTAAKCNYCAHRVDIGLEPACVNVCPEHAIISGDLDDPSSEIAQLVGREPVTARKTSKGTRPNLFYIDGDEAALVPSATMKSQVSAISAATRGVGHFANTAEKVAKTEAQNEAQKAQWLAQNAAQNQGFDGDNLIRTLLENSGKTTDVPQRSIDLLVGDSLTKTYYDAPDKGILWGREVWTYVWTKGIAAGSFLIPFAAVLSGRGSFVSIENWYQSIIIGLFFLMITTALLVKDLDQPRRFLYVLLRPQWRSWLVKGGWALTLFGVFLSVFGLAFFFKISWLGLASMWLTAAAAVVTAIYTAFLFAQAKGRDFWQSPTLAFHMLGHSLAAGAAMLLIVSLVSVNGYEWIMFLRKILMVMTVFNLFIALFELFTPHPTDDARLVSDMILKGRYARQFWIGSVGIGAILPLAMLFFWEPGLWPFAAMLVLAGVFVTEKIWVEGPQRIALS